MKKFLTILPLLITAVVLATGIIWLGFSFQEDQKQTFQVIESGQTKTSEKDETCSPDNMTAVCAITSMGSLPTYPPPFDGRQMKLAWDMCLKEHTPETCSQIDPDGFIFYLVNFYHST